MMPGGAISFSESEENIIVRFLFWPLWGAVANFCVIYCRLKQSYILMTTLKSCRDGTNR